MDLFGLKGSWIRIFLLCLGICVAPALVLAIVFSIGAFVAVMLVGGGVSFIGCMILQGKAPERRLYKVRLSGKMELSVRRRENLSRIIILDPEYERMALERERRNK